MALNEIYWKFKEFISESGGEFENWVNSLPPADQAKIDVFIGRLRLMKTWSPKLVFPLTGYRKIYELKIHGPGVQYRPLGCYGPGRNEFTLLIGAKEVGSKFEPKDAPNKAVERQKLIQDKRLTKYLWTDVKEK
jgi:hypothetical protein